MAKDAVVDEKPVAIDVAGDAGELPTEVATPLAVVLTELLQNAAEHAFPGRPDPPGGRRVDVTLFNDGTTVTVRVHDNGRGLPDGFSVDASNSLGLSIVRNLVTGQLSGTIDMRNDGGAVVELRLPVAHPG
jgi:two-component sensor histidine kinase